MMNLASFNNEMDKIASQAPKGLVTRLMDFISDEAQDAAQEAAGAAAERISKTRPSTAVKFGLAGAGVGAIRGVNKTRQEAERDRRLYDMGMMDPDAYRQRQQRRLARVGLNALGGAAVGTAVPYAWTSRLNSVRKDLLDNTLNPALDKARGDLREVMKATVAELQNATATERKALAIDVQSRAEESASRAVQAMRESGGLLGALVGKGADAPKKKPAMRRLLDWLRSRGKDKTAARVDYEKPAQVSEDDWNAIRSVLSAVIAAGGTTAAMHAGVGMKLPVSLLAGGVVGGATGLAVHGLQGGFNVDAAKLRRKRRALASRQSQDEPVGEGNSRHRSQVSSRLLLPSGLQRRAEEMALQGKSSRNTDRYFRGEDDRYRYGGKASGTRRFERGGLLSGSDS